MLPEARWASPSERPSVGLVATSSSRSSSGDLPSSRRARWRDRYAAAVKASGHILYDFSNVTQQAILAGACESLLGYSPEELSGDLARWLDLVHPEDRESFHAEFHRSRQTRTPYHLEYRVRRKDGAYIVVQDDGQHLYDETGQPVRMIGFVKDVTETRIQARKLSDAHLALEESHSLLAALLRTAPVGIAFFDRELRYTRVNEHLADLNGLPVEAHLGRKTSELLPGLPDQEIPMRAVLEEGRTYLDHEILGETLKQPGRQREWSVSYYPVNRPDGSRLGVGAILQEVTERKRAEQELRDADRRKDEFLAMLAHELRNPLAPICSALDVLAAAKDDPESLEWSRDVIDRQVRHLTSLVDELLDVSRITRGKITLTKRPITVLEFLSHAIEASRPLIERRGHHLEVEIPEEPLQVDGDLTRLSQVVLNLLNNAAKYTPTGGHIRLSAQRAGDSAVIRVKDDGVGIPAEVLPHIFDLFMQVDHSLDRSEGGLGIGLTLVRRLVELHGGTVEAQSKGAGKGSEFVVRLPGISEARPAPGSNGTNHTTDRPERRPRRILVVDDNRDIVESVARVLRSQGHHVETALEGQAACESALRFRPEIVLLDIAMPGMDGYEVARRLRAEPSIDGVFLIAVSGYGSASDYRASEAAGFDAHLVKPVQGETLHSLVSQVPFRSRFAPDPQLIPSPLPGHSPARVAV